MQHHFDIDLAKRVGVNAAIIFDQISFWVTRNEANKNNFADGQYWTYNSVSAFEDIFPYLGAKAIRNALSKLVDSEYLVTGNYNKRGGDRTLWYALGSLGITHLSKGQMDSPKGQMEIAERANGFAQRDKALPVTNTVTNTAIKKTSTKKPDSWKTFFTAYPENKKGGRDQTAWKKAKSLHLTDEDFQKMVFDIEQRRAMCPKWFSTYAPSICKYLGEYIWETPVIPEVVYGAGNRRTIEEEITDTSWFDGGSDQQVVCDVEMQLPELLPQSISR